MTKTLRLVRNYFNCLIGSFVSKRKKGKYLTGVLFVALIGVGLVFIFTNQSIAITLQFRNSGVPQLAMYLNCAMALMMMLLLTVMRSAMPSKTTDEGLLLSLPITRTQIILAKSLYNYLFDLISLLGVLLPGFIVYYVLIDGTSFMVIINGFILLLFIPFFSNALGYFIGLIFQKISSSFRNYSLIQTILILILIGSFMYLQFALQSFLTKSIGNFTEILNKFLPLKWMMTYILNNDLSGLLKIASVCLSFYGVSVIIRSSLLGHELKSYRSKKTRLDFTVHKPWVALYFKELKNYFSIAVYIINTIIGSVLYIALGIFISFVDESKIQGFIQTLQLQGLSNALPPILTMLSCLLIATVCTTSPSISLEGKHIWILQAHPVKVRDVFLGKILVNLTLTVIPIVIVAPFVAISLGFEYLILLLPFPLLVSFIVSIYGLLFNLLFPKMQWESEIAPVKQSLSVAISLFFGVFLIMVPFILFLVGVLAIPFSLFAPLLALFYLFVIGIGIFLLATTGKRHFQEL